MADFFTRLAERALGVAPVAAPDLPPMFAPAVQPLELSTEIVAPQPPAGVEVSSGKRPSPTALVENPTSRRPPEVVRDGMRRSDELRSPLVNVRFAQNQGEDTTLSIHRAEKVSLPAAQSALHSSSTVSTVPAAAAVKARKEAASTNPSPAPLSEALVGSPIRAEPAAPAIHVTIGRVEVRAVSAPAEPARPRERKAPPLLSLDQYLRQRNEGRR